MNNSKITLVKRAGGGGVTQWSATFWRRGRRLHVVGTRRILQERSHHGLCIRMQQPPSVMRASSITAADDAAARGTV